MATKYEMVQIYENEKSTTFEKPDLVYADLSYNIMGALFDVWSTIGYGHKELFYQRAIAQELGARGIKFKEQLPAKVHYKDKFIGIYYLDFLIENKIVLEIKVREYFSKHDINQLYSYLKATN